MQVAWSRMNKWICNSWIEMTYRLFYFFITHIYFM